jgi:hypothetical protein
MLAYDKKILYSGTIAHRERKYWKRSFIYKITVLGEEFDDYVTVVPKTYHYKRDEGVGGVEPTNYFMTSFMNIPQSM